MFKHMPHEFHVPKCKWSVRYKQLLCFKNPSEFRNSNYYFRLLSQPFYNFFLFKKTRIKHIRDTMSALSIYIYIYIYIYIFIYIYIYSNPG